MNIKGKKFSAGDKVKVKLKTESFEGIIMPQSNEKFILLKIKSGYNIGFKVEDINAIEKISTVKLEAFPEAKIKQKPNLPEIAFLTAGGTIASRVDYVTGGVTSLMKPENLFSLVPEIAEITRVNVEQVFSILSENIEAKYWKILAEKVGEWLNKKDIEGAVITHGTDTLHYTSAALSFMLKDLNKPVAITYAQRSSDRPSTDAILNLKSAVRVALSDIAEVSVVGHHSINDDSCFVLRGTKVRKMHSMRRDTFRPINALPIAKVTKEGKIEIISEYRKRHDGKVKVDAVFNDKVALIKFYPNASPKILDFYHSQGYKGIIIEGTGMGHVSIDGKYNWLKTLKDITKDMFVGMTTQCIYGSTNAYVYSTARELSKVGVTYLHDMLAETALVKLGWAFGKEKSIDKVKEIMLENIAGEFNDRETPETFLY